MTKGVVYFQKNRKNKILLQSWPNSRAKGKPGVRLLLNLYLAFIKEKEILRNPFLKNSKTSAKPNSIIMTHNL